jgi:molybdopterin converting factor small subunit
MSVTVQLPSILTPFTAGANSLTAAGTTVGQAISDIAVRYPELEARLRDERGAPYPFVTFYLNDEDIRFLAGFDTEITEGDELTVVPAVAGG